MNLFGLMETSGSAMQAERMRAEVVAANMANAETTRTASGGPYRRQQVVFAANRGDAGFLDSLDSASRSASGAAFGDGLQASWRGRSAHPHLARNGHHSAGRPDCPGRRRPLPLSNASIPAIPTPDPTAMSPIPILIRSQRWWT